jgi:late competence protein required for DNA uptake (superfamily II DNA/RNA helicase)
MFATSVGSKFQFCKRCVKETFWLAFQGDGCIAWCCRSCLLLSKAKEKNNDKAA